MGSAVMGLEEARRILRGRAGSIDALGPEYVQWATAGATVLDHYQANRHLMRPVRFTDASAHAGQTVEAIQQEREGAVMIRSGWLSAFGDQGPVGQPAGNASPGGKTPGAAGGGRVGAKLVMELDGPVSAYFVAANGDGTACLYRSSNIDGRGDTQQTAVLDKRTRALFEYEGIRTKAKLQQMNERNRAFWETHQR